MRFILGTSHLISWSGSEISLALLAKCLRDAGHDVFVYATYYSRTDFIEELLDGCDFTSSLSDLEKFCANGIYTQHHTTAMRIRSICPRIPMAHALLGVLPHLERLPPIDLGVNTYLPISEEVVCKYPDQLSPNGNATIFRNIVDDTVFTEKPVDQPLNNLVCYSYKISDEKCKLLEEAAQARGLSVIDYRTTIGAISYRSVPTLLTRGEIVVASGRGAIEAMLCGRVPLILSDCGDDGLVTPENFDLHMRTNFSGRTTARKLDAEKIGIELELYKQNYGAELQQLARQHFGLQARQHNVFELFHNLAAAESVALSDSVLEKIKFEVETYDSQRTFTLLEARSRNNSDVCNFVTAEATLYYSEFENGGYSSFSEHRSVTTNYQILNLRQIISLLLPPDLKPLARIRLDPANQPVLIKIHCFTFFSHDGVELWRCSGEKLTIQNLRGIVLHSSGDDLILVCTDNDPQFDLVLPDIALAEIRGRSRLMVEFTPSPILKALPDLLFLGERFHQVTGQESVQTVSKNTLEPANVTGNIRNLGDQLDSLAGLVSQNLSNRDRVIFHQSMQIKTMRDELVRAEAQLDLLKEVMLGSRDNDSL